MCMHIIAGRCLSTSIAYCSRAFLFFPSFTLSPSSLSSLFFPSFPSYLSLLLFLYSSLPLSLPFFFTISFPTPLFLQTSPFPPISSSLILPLLSFRSLLSLVASFSSNPLFFPIPPLIQPLLFSTPSFLPIPLSILSLLSILPLHSVLPLLPLHSFLPTIPFIPIYPSHHTALFLPIPLALPPLLFFISLLYLFATFPSSASFIFSHFFPSSPSLPPLLPFLLLHSFLPPPFLACLLPFPSLGYLLPLLLFLPSFTSTFPPTSPSSPTSLTFPFSCHSPRLPFPALLRSPPFSFFLLAPSLSLSPY